MVTVKKSERRGQGQGGGRPRIGDTVKDDVVRMYSVGLPVSMIVNKHGIAKSSIYRILHERTVSDGDEKA